MSTYQRFKTNPELEKNGIVLDLGEVGKFTIARAGGANQKFEKRMAALTKPHRRAIQAGTIDQQILSEITATAAAETIVLGWEGVTGPDGQPLEFNVANCKQLLTDLPELFTEIVNAARDHTLYLQHIREEDAGNS